MQTRSELIIAIKAAKSNLKELESTLESLDKQSTTTTLPTLIKSSKWPFNSEEYERYGRQMILSEIGSNGQLLLKNSKILVIGAGGLGCPVLLYLAAAGIGEITILDHDTVDLSNLHRQVLHTEERVGMSKAKSAEIALKSINSTIKINAICSAFTPNIFSSNSSIPELSKPNFNLILDCTDNPATRHLINIYSATYKIPLVSGGAVRTEGVVGIYSLPSKIDGDIGPCYACIFPSTPPSIVCDDENEEELRQEKLALLGTGACSDEGVFGVLCGSVGLTMCSEAIRVILGTAKPTLHLLSPLSNNPFRTIKVRNKKLDCSACSISTNSTPQSRWQSKLEILNLTNEWPDWINPLCDLPQRGLGVGRITVNELKAMEEVQLIDVRSKVEFEIAHLDNSINIPFSKLLRNPSLANSSPLKKTVIICKKGNDSFIAARALRRDSKDIEVFDVVGGLKAWSKIVDDEFPIY